MDAHAENPPRLTVCESREELGRKAADEAADALKSTLDLRGKARLMLAAADSQRATLQALSTNPGIDWSRVRCFQMDEYIGLPEAATQRFANWLQANFFCLLPDMPIFESISPTGSGTAEAQRYEAVMGAAPFDVVLLGLGVNGHLAFNDPPADLTDPQGVRVVTLDPISRQQQVDEGHFFSLDQVPCAAITATIPRLLNSARVIASVPGRQKQEAVMRSLTMPVSGLYPGTALRTHPRVSLYLDRESGPSGSVTVPSVQEEHLSPN